MINSLPGQGASGRGPVRHHMKTRTLNNLASGRKQNVDKAPTYSPRASLVGCIAWAYLQSDAVFYGARATLGLGGLSNRYLTVGKWILAILAVLTLLSTQNNKTSPAAFTGRSRTVLLYAVVATSSFANYVRYAGGDPVQKYLLYVLSLALPALIVGLCLRFDDLVKARQFGLYISTLAIVLMLITSRKNGLTDSGYLNDVGGASHLLVGQTAAIALILSTYFLMNRKTGRSLSLFVMFTSIYLLLISGSRGSLIAAVCAVVYYGSSVIRDHKLTQRLGPRVLKVGIVIFTGIAAGSYFYSSLQYSSLARQKFDSLFTGGDQSTEVRQFLYRVAGETIREHPIFGSGVGGYAQHMGVYVYPHNLFLEVLCDFGLFGLVIIALIVYRMWANWHHVETRLAGAILVTAIVILLFSGSYALQPLFWFSLALTGAPRRVGDVHERTVSDVDRTECLSPKPI